MSEQHELFVQQFSSDGAGFHPSYQQTEPLVWVKHLLLLREWNPGEENVIRRIALRPGLNILWAKPRSNSEKPRLGEQGVYGHASGKTTFCRLIRHVLGEKHFGTADLQSRMRQTFHGGWVVGEVRVNQESWLVCRPFTLGSHPFVLRGAPLDQLFDEELKRERLEVYEEALNAVVMHPLPVATFATSPESIQWAHLIQWLARDQECRFADLTDFRHKSSESDSPGMDVEDRHFLFRAMLNLIDTDEQSELEKNKDLLEKKQKIERQAPLFKHQAKIAYKRLQTDLGNEYSSLEGELFLGAVMRNYEEKAQTSNQTITSLVEPEELQAAQSSAMSTQARLENKLSEIKQLQENIESLEFQVKGLRGEKTQAEVDAFLASKTPGSGLCLEPLVRAKANNCPLIFGKKIPGDQEKTAIKIERKSEDFEKTILAQKKYLGELEAEKALLEVAAKQDKDAWMLLQREFTQTREKLLENRLSITNIIRRAKEAFHDNQEAEKLESSQGDLEKEIRLSREKQSGIREKQKRAVSDFSQIFDRVAKAIMGMEINASIHFDGRQIAIKMTQRGDLTSAAIETLKILTFDLSAMFSGIEGRGFHPRILIHDGPREADMASDLYQKIFLLARELENAFHGKTPTFQYIITTTEPPPEELQQTPWLIDPVLDASTKEGRLLKEDL